MRGVESLHVLDDYWRPAGNVRTEVGLLVHRARDLDDPAAAARLAVRFAGLAARIPVPSGGPPNLVTGVPSGPPSATGQGDPTLVSRPGRASDDAYAPLTQVDHAATRGRAATVASHLARALAAAGAGEWRPGLLGRRRDSPKMQDVEPEAHDEVAAGLGYMALEPVADRHIVLVDDVMLTGATLRAVARCLHSAGAASVTAAVAARSRRR